MNPEKPEQVADRWLHAALKEYSAVEPPPGIESRIMELSSRASHPSWFAASFAWPAAAAIVLVALLLGSWATWRSHRMNQASAASLPIAPAVTARLGAPSGTSMLPAQAKSILAMRHRELPSKAVPSWLPRRDQFPSPAPLSEVERLMIAYVRNTPREEVLLVIARQAVENEKAQEAFNFDSAPDLGSEGELQ